MRQLTNAAEEEKIIILWVLYEIYKEERKREKKRDFIHSKFLKFSFNLFYLGKWLICFFLFISF